MTNISFILLYIYIGILCLFFGLIALNLYSKEKDYLKFIRPILVFWNNSLVNFDKFIKLHLERWNYWDKMTLLGLSLYNKLYNNEIIIVSIILFSILPKFIIVCAFLLDIYIFHKFYYFYKLSFILLIPLIYNYVFYSLKYFSETNLIELSNEIQITDKKGEIFHPITVSFKIIRGEEIDNKFELTNGEKEFTTNWTSFQKQDHLIYYVKIYMKMHKIFALSMDISFYKDLITPYVNILIYSLYAIGWSYIIWYGL